MRNAKWDNAAHTSILLEINHPKHGWIPFGAVNGDPTTQAVFDAAVAAGGIAEYTPPVPPSAAQLAAKRRSEITVRLAAIDRETIPFLRKKAVGKSKAEDDTKLNALDTEAETLRTELVTL